MSLYVAVTISYKFSISDSSVIFEFLCADNQKYGSIVSIMKTTIVIRLVSLLESKVENIHSF